VVASQRNRVLPRFIEDEMKQSFLDYSMSVIVQRALPDVRDGLKPVHRRILYAMYETGLLPTRPFKKSATVVGDVLGRYHPHGDTAVYDALVRMVQEFSLRYPLVQGQGNFGSIDGDSAAAYRYTEARLAAIAVEMMQDIDRETVDFAPNFDDRLQEPTVVPARLPNLLVNGSSGIAVGMSTNIPPHNLGEVVGAAVHLLDHPGCTIDDLMRYVPGPDFPTGGLIVGTAGIRDAYHGGRGRVVMRARVSREQKRGGREQLVVTELPFMVNKSRLIEQIAELVKKDKVGEVSDLRDESDREGIRVVIELKRGANAEAVVNAFYKWTHLQSTFGVIMLALDAGVPRELNLKEILERYRDHRVEVVVRRSRWELEKARDEAHVLEGLLVAIKNIDEVVRIIRGSKDRAQASLRLIERFELTERQSGAILDMRLARLTALESREIKARLAELRKRIKELEAILASPARQVAVVREELLGLAERYGDPRRTTIMEGEAELAITDVVAEEEVVVTISHAGFIQRMPIALYRRRAGSGKPLAGMDRYEDDYLEHAFVAGSHDTLMFFGDDGRVHWLSVLDIPEAGRASRGKALYQLLDLPRQSHIAALLALPRQVTGEAMLVFATAEGIVKRTPLDQFANPRSGGVQAIVLREGDRLVHVQLSSGGDDVVLATSAGRAIRFQESDVTPVGRVAQGVRGIKLARADTVVGMVVVRRETSLCTVTERGFAKRTEISGFPLQKRGGLGIVAMSVSPRTGAVAGALEVLPGDELMVLMASGRAVRLPGDEVPEQGRSTQGRALVELEDDDRVVEVTRVAGARRSTRQEASSADTVSEPVELTAGEVGAGEESGGSDADEGAAPLVAGTPGDDSHEDAGDQYDLLS
jgi:DNA gyrase subunit A